MTHAVLLSPTERRQKWLQLRKTRRSGGMPQAVPMQARRQAPRVYCDPRMPQGWSEILD